MNSLLRTQILRVRASPLTQLTQLTTQFPRLVRTGASLTSPSTIQSKIVTEAPNHSQEKAVDRRRLPNRSGVIAVKRGMSQWFDKDTEKVYPITILEVNQVEVVYNKTKDKEGYYAVQVGYGSKNPHKESRQMLGHFEKAQVNPKLTLAEFMVKSEDGLLPVGTLLNADHFQPGQFVDIKGVSKGKGFAGVMKRYGMKGQKASHGASLSHRSGGSYGANTSPGRVLPGKRMPGRMGGISSTKQNSLVVSVENVDETRGMILVKGHVPGPTGSFVKLSDAIKKM